MPVYRALRGSGNRTASCCHGQVVKAHYSQSCFCSAAGQQQPGSTPFAHFLGEVLLERGGHADTALFDLAFIMTLCLAAERCVEMPR